MGIMKYFWLALIILLTTQTSFADIGLICTLNGEKEQILKNMTVEDKSFKSERERFCQ